MERRSYDAIVLDLDGTLVTDAGTVHPRTRERLEIVQERGVTVMLATGRSEGGTRAVLDELRLTTPALVYNGAALFCPVEDRLLETRLLSDRAVQKTLAFAREQELLCVVMRFAEKICSEPRDADEHRAIQFLEELSIVPREELPDELVVRITLFSDRHGGSDAFETTVERAIDQELYLTSFPLNALADHRQSTLQVVDVQPPCRGKGEALRVLEERYGIAAERVVVVGDANNDVPMMRRAGLAVAMDNSMGDALAAAHRVIGSNNTDSIATLLDELFLDA